MKQRILRPGNPAVTVHFTDDYSRPIHVAYVSIEMDDWSEEMLMRWTLEGEDTIAAFNAIQAKDLEALMDVLDRYEARLPVMEADLLDDARHLGAGT